MDDRKHIGCIVLVVDGGRVLLAQKRLGWQPPATPERRQRLVFASKSMFACSARSVRPTRICAELQNTGRIEQGGRTGQKERARLFGPHTS